MSRARYHFSGVGGAGMSPLARLMRARGHAVQDRQVQLEHALPGVEHPAEVLTQPAGDLLHVDLGHQVEVELGAQLRHRGGEDLRALLGRVVIGQVVRHPGVDELRQR